MAFRRPSSRAETRARARARMLAKERRERQKRSTDAALAKHAAQPKRAKFLTRAAKKELLKLARERQERKTAMSLKAHVARASQPPLKPQPPAVSSNSSMKETEKTLMALTPKQKTAALNQARAAQSGDTKAIAFFDAIKANNPSLWKEYDALINGSAEVVGGIKRADLQTNTKALSPKQFSTGVRQGLAACEGKDGAIAFFASMEKSAEQGSAQSIAFLGMRDELLEHARNGTKPGNMARATNGAPAAPRKIGPAAGQVGQAARVPDLDTFDEPTSPLLSGRGYSPRAV